MAVQFAQAFTEKTGEEAARELSMRIKTLCGASVKYLLVFFTAHNHPITLMQSLKRTINPKFLWGLEAPILIFEDKAAIKGVLAIAINGDEVALRPVFTKSDAWESVESVFRKELKDFSGEKSFLFSSLPVGANFANYRRGISMVLGKNTNIIGAGYMKRFAQKQYVIMDDKVDEGSFSLVGKNISLETIRMGGFVPLGKPFTVTKALPDHSMVIEINNKPAAEMYKFYFEDKFESFKKHRYFSFYPIGIREGPKLRLVSVVDILNDGSLVCLGSIKEGSRANFTILHQPSLFQSIRARLEPIRKHGEGFVFMINSLMRKKILMDSYSEEIRAIKTHLGDKFKISGIYADYTIYPDKQLMEIGMETGNLLISLWG
jgi:FIST C domain/FIST N domain